MEKNSKKRIINLKKVLAFIVNLAYMLIRYTILLPLVIKRAKGSEIITYYDQSKYDLKFVDLQKERYSQEAVDFVKNSEKYVSYNLNRYKLEVLNVLGIVELDERFATYEEAEEFAKKFMKEHCSVLNIEIIDTFRENTDTEE